MLEVSYGWEYAPSRGGIDSQGTFWFARSPVRHGGSPTERYRRKSVTTKGTTQISLPPEGKVHLEKHLIAFHVGEQSGIGEAEVVGLAEDDMIEHADSENLYRRSQ